MSCLPVAGDRKIAGEGGMMSVIREVFLKQNVKMSVAAGEHP